MYNRRPTFPSAPTLTKDSLWLFLFVDNWMRKEWCLNGTGPRSGGGSLVPLIRVVFIAASCVVMGILILGWRIWLAKAGLPAMQAEYASECRRWKASSSKCTHLADTIESISASSKIGLLVPTLLGWAVSGGIGLWAVLLSNVSAIKLFLRSQALLLLMGQVNFVIHIIDLPKAFDSWTSLAFEWLFGTLCGLYQLKVIWSYQMLSLKRSSRSELSSSSNTAEAGGMIELEGSSQVV
eukprot:g18060.t1